MPPDNKPIQKHSTPRKSGRLFERDPSCHYYTHYTAALPSTTPTTASVTLPNQRQQESKPRERFSLQNLLAQAGRLHDIASGRCWFGEATPAPAPVSHPFTTNTMTTRPRKKLAWRIELLVEPTERNKGLIGYSIYGARRRANEEVFSRARRGSLAPIPQ